MREKFERFMAGRYGNDQLNMFLLLVCALSTLIAALIRATFLGWLFELIALFAVGFSFVRMFSRDLHKRSRENGKYLQLKYKGTNEARMLRERWIQRKYYKFFHCPACRTRLRVPKGKGKVNIVCRKCGYSFKGRT